MKKRQIKLPSITKDWVHKKVIQIDTAVHVVLMLQKYLWMYKTICSANQIAFQTEIELYSYTSITIDTVLSNLIVLFLCFAGQK